jgi:hypothetical protein
MDDNKLNTTYKESNKKKEFQEDITRRSFYPSFATSRIHPEKENHKMNSTKRISIVETHQNSPISNTLKEKNEEVDEELRKQYNYFKYLNKIQNISVIGSTRLETPLNRKEYIYNQLKLQRMSPNKNKVYFKQTEYSLNNSQFNSTSTKEVFRHNKPLSLNNINIASKIKKKMLSDKNGLPRLTSINMIEGFKYGKKENFKKFDINLSTI